MGYVNPPGQSFAKRRETFFSFLFELGGEPVERSSGGKGFFLETFSAIRGLTGIRGALGALRTDEEITNRTCRDALSKPLPPDVRSLFEQNRQDEQRHLGYLEGVLSAREWETAVPKQS